jgi:thiamine-monophosphate kinase
VVAIGIRDGGRPRDDRSTVGDLGEFPLVDRIVARLTRVPARGALLGPGDDAAVVAAADGRVVATTDVLVEGRHFRLDWSSAVDVGHKAAAQNLADVAAMGARPTALLVGLGVPAGTPVAWVDGLADGLGAEAAHAGAVVVGGDVVAASEIVVAVTALGDLGGRAPVTRAGARPGDVVAVAGRLGWGAAGLRLLRAGHTSGPLVDAHRRPDPPYAAGPSLAALGATAMIDVSDGLLADLGHVAAASGARIDVDLAATRALGAPDVTDDDVLTGGEDHALAAALPPDAPLPDFARVIGRVAAGSGVWVDGAPAGRRGGHVHFAGRGDR